MPPRTRKKPALDTVPIVATRASSRLSGKEQGIAGIKPNKDKREDIADVAVNEVVSVIYTKKQGGKYSTTISAIVAGIENKEDVNVNNDVPGIKNKEDINVNNNVPGIKNKEDITLNNNDTVKEGVSVNMSIAGIENKTLNNNDTVKKGIIKVAAALAETKFDKESQSEEDEDWEDTFESAESMPPLIKIVNKKHCSTQTKKGGKLQIDGRKGGRRLAAFLTLYPKLMTRYLHLTTSWQQSEKIQLAIWIVIKRRRQIMGILVYLPVLYQAL